MCGRFVLHKNFPGLPVIEGLEDLDVEPRYNIAPTQLAPVARVVEGEPQWSDLRWGLVPPWADDLAFGNKCINARSETLLQKRAFRSAYEHRRCLVPATGFYEWRKEGRQRRPFFISRVDGAPLCFAGLWESWGQGSDRVQSFTIVTTTANSDLERLHDRMPVMVAPSDRERWLTTPGTDDAALLLAPSPAGELQLVEVGRGVNDVRHEGPDCIAPSATSQGELF